MKTLAELSAIRDKMKAQEANRTETKIVVGLATCGIAAGATPVYDAFVASAAGNKNVIVAQTGCIGICQYEPVVEVLVPGQQKVTYVKMTAEKAKRVFDEHVMGGKVVTEYTIGAAAK